MVIGNYVYSPAERSNGCECYFVRPNFEPRKVEHTTFDGQAAEAAVQARPAAETLSPEQKSALREKLNHGRGGMSLQQWDDFLADLEELGVITHDERFTANGTLHDIPAAAQNGGTHFSSGNTTKDLMQMWKGNPQQWLDDMDLYALKNQLYANIGKQTALGRSGQRDAYQKVAQIVKDILY
ncbi:MAG: hypothetical protein HDT14_04280 [Oscillibacter sp.]|nr:hypothetical protein [Oscillibacter sp.]